MADWISILREHVERGDAELDLSQLSPGDRVRVVTKNTIYDFLMQESPAKGYYAIVKTDRPNRPSGLVRINGCTFGLSTTIKPDHLFCGGNVEFIFDDGNMIHTTTAIREIHWLRAQPGC